MSDIEQKCRVALLALSDWAVTYAPDMCDPETVEKAKARILENGTLAYVANATDQLHAAIQLLSEAETREREVRAKALEEAAKVADEMPVLLMTSPVHVKAASPQDVARRIRALQSEER